MTRAAAFLLVLSLAACQRAPEPPAKTANPAPKPTAQRADDDTVSMAETVSDIDGDNLLNLAYGASVVSRTGESNLESSAVHAIDGISFSVWSSSPGASEQTMVYSLGAPSRVEQLGVTTNGKEQSPAKVRFEASMDARSWRDVATIDPANRGTTMNEVEPFDARYLRVTAVDLGKYYVALVSVHAIGRELRPAERMSFDGCWTLNGRPARIVQRGARITGVIGGAVPTFLDGGLDGRAWKLMWMRGPMWGYAVATVTPDGRNFSAVTFHEDPRSGRVAEAWLGGRCEGAVDPPATPIAQPADYLRRTRRWMMAGIVFEGEERIVAEASQATLDDAAAAIRAMPSQRFRVSAYEFRNNDPKENRRRTGLRIEAIRAALQSRGIDVSKLEFVSNGDRHPGAEVPSAVQRMLESRIDLELLASPRR